MVLYSRSLGILDEIAPLDSASDGVGDMVTFALKIQIDDDGKPLDFEEESGQSVGAGFVQLIGTDASGQGRTG